MRANPKAKTPASPAELAAGRPLERLPLPKAQADVVTPLWNRVCELQQQLAQAERELGQVCTFALKGAGVTTRAILHDVEPGADGGVVLAYAPAPVAPVVPADSVVPAVYSATRRRGRRR